MENRSLKYLALAFLLLGSPFSRGQSPMGPQYLSYVSFLEKQTREALARNNLDKISHMIDILSESHWFSNILDNDREVREKFFQLVDLVIDAPLSSPVIDKEIADTLLLRFSQSKIFHLPYPSLAERIVRAKLYGYLRKWVSTIEKRAGEETTEAQKSLLKNVYPLLAQNDYMRPWLLSTIKPNIQKYEYMDFLLSKEGSLFFKDEKTRRLAFKLTPWSCQNSFLEL